jgi:hypothetical protein
MSRNGSGSGQNQDQAARLWLSWLLVAVLLGYGVIQTGITAAKLFTG